MKVITEPVRYERFKLLSLDADRLVVEWIPDKHRSEWTIRELRKWCPCATCRVEKEKLAANPLAVISTPMNQVMHIEDLAAVGRYAVSFLFSDGHSSGIYAYDYLRNICPCAECASKANTETTE
jgi:DUF971 family protein